MAGPQIDLDRLWSRIEALGEHCGARDYGHDLGGRAARKCI